MIFATFVAQADDALDWQNVYSEIKKNYIKDLNCENLAVAALKGINNIDKNLKLANDNTRISIYYKRKVVKVLRKPEDVNDDKSWGHLSAEVIKAAVSASPIVDEKSFKIADEMAKGILNILDKDSVFYANMDEAEGMSKRNKRHWADRLFDDNVLYIKITAFNKQSFSNMQDALNKYTDADKLIIDVRGCPGGMAGEAIKIADLFLDEGIIASVKSKDQTSLDFYNADKDELFASKEIEIWTDEQTASAAEILAAALQEQGRAIIKGKKTFGKGSMQKLILLPSGSILAVTSGYFQTPSGRELNGNGIIPDIEDDNLPEY